MGVAGVVLLAWLVSLSVFDIMERRLPNWLTMPGAIVIVTVAAGAGRGLPALAGAVVLFTVYLIVHLLAPAAMGAGDVKLAIGVGALTGAFGIDIWTLAAVGAPLITAVWALVAIVRHAQRTVPHGVSMCLSAATATALVTLG